jgi:predicted transglutaminase-like cysteine proteinase
MKASLAALLLLLPLSACATPRDAFSSALSVPMTLGADAPPPVGLLDYCQRSPEDCGVAAGPDARRQVSRRYWTAVFTSGSTSPGRVDWTAVLAAAAQAPKATTREEGSDAEEGRLTADALLNARGAGAGAALAEPAAELAAPAQVAWDARNRDLFDRVNREVNRAILPRKDKDLGVVDHWGAVLAADGRRWGDCEDYVLEKRRRLIAGGVPAGALSIALVQAQNGEAHAVLLAGTDRGEFVLDNLTPWIVPWTEAPYRWLERQAPGAAFRWVRISPPPPEAAGATDGGLIRNDRFDPRLPKALRRIVPSA